MLKAFNSKRKKGFTLIELLVVIAILGILVLLAAPRFLGYTKDANVATMQADAKVLSNAALIYNIENDGDWPVVLPEGVESLEDLESVATVEGIEIYDIDESALSGQVQTLEGDYEDYGIALGGTNEGVVLHKDGVQDRDGVTHFGNGIEAETEVEAGD